MLRKFFLTLSICAFGAALFAQTRSPSVLSAGGGTAVGNRLLLEWTLGETAVQSIHTPGILLTEGFHQPFIKVETVVPAPFVDKHEVRRTIGVSMSPNPTMNSLTIKVEGINEEGLLVKLMDSSGKLLKNESIPPLIEELTMSISELVPGVYYLPVLDTNGNHIKTFKVSKM